MFRNNKWSDGFTLLELLLALSISSIIVVCLYSILSFTINTCKLGSGEDEVLLNGRYAIEYIKREIKSAEKVISIDKCEGLNQKYEDNIGFVIMRYIPNANYKYNYSSYYLKNDIIYRIVANKNNDKYPDRNSFGGHNEVAEYVKSIEGTSINFKTKTIDLVFILKGENGREIKFRSKLSIRCPVTP